MGGPGSVRAVCASGVQLVTGRPLWSPDINMFYANILPSAIKSTVNATNVCAAELSPTEIFC